MNQVSKGRVVTGCVTSARRSSDDAIAKTLGELIVRAEFQLMRHVVVKPDTPFLQTLVQNVANDNEADALIIVGGTGLGPKDETIVALEPFFEKRIEGFGEAYRRLMRGEHGVHSMLYGATAGVFNQCVVFAFSGNADDVRMTADVLVVPVLAEAIALAYGRPVPARG